MKRILCLFLIFCQFTYSQTTTAEIDTTLKNPDIEKLKLEIQNLKSEKLNLETELQNKDKVLSTKQEHNQSLQRELTKLKTEIESKDKSIKNSKSEAEKLNETIEKLNIKIGDFEEEKVQIKLKKEELSLLEEEILEKQNQLEISILEADARKSQFKFRITLIIRLVSLLLISGLSYFLYKMVIFRRINNGSIEQLPELTYTETKERMIKLGENFAKLANYLNELGSTTNAINSQNSKRFDEIISSLNVFTKSLIEKDKEIERLKDGYDSKLKIDVLKSMIILKDRLDYLIDENDSNDESLKLLRNILNVLENQFEDLGLIKLIFKEGDLWRNVDGAEAEELVNADDESKKGQIIKTIKHGYYIEGLDGAKVIVRKAKVSLYKG